MRCSCPLGDRLCTGFGLAICRRCGVAIRAMAENIVSYNVCCSARPPYSREKRFARLLCNTYGHRCSKVHDTLIDALTKLDLGSPGSIYTYIRRSQNRAHKRYDCLAFLSMHILPNHKITPLRLNQSKWANFAFREAVIRHQQIGGTFPAYQWCIEKVLSAIHRTDLIEYVHVLKCKKRRAYYEKNYSHIFTTPAADLT
jgi:hypothetical protein